MCKKSSKLRLYFNGEKCYNERGSGFPKVELLEAKDTIQEC